MGDSAAVRKPQQAPASEPARAKPPLGMSADDHASFEDLLFQQAAETTLAAIAAPDPKKRNELAGLGMARARTALDGYSMPGAAKATRSTFRSIDGAFKALQDLHAALHGAQEPIAETYASAARALMLEISNRLAPMGWKAPVTPADGQSRAADAASAGSTSISIEERSRLGHLHLRAARQHLLGAWEDIAAGKLGALAMASHDLRDAASILADPRLAEMLGTTADEMAQTELVFERVAVAMSEARPDRVPELRGLASDLDALRRIIGKEPRFVTLTARPPMAKSSQQPAAAPPAQTGAPGSNGPTGVNAAATNDVDRGAPRAEPGMHRIEEIQRWTRKVHIMDTNWEDEYIGYVELSFEAYRTASGQVYATAAKATKHFDQRGTQYLSIGANVVANSIDLHGKRFCDVYFDVQIGGPNKTETTTLAIGAKKSESDTADGGTSGGELSATLTFSTAVTSQGTKNFRRVFRVSNLDSPVKLQQYDLANPYQPKTISTSMLMAERADLREDFEDFRLDDDDVGDTLTTLYADWILHSYDE